MIFRLKGSGLALPKLFSPEKRSGLKFNGPRLTLPKLNFTPFTVKRTGKAPENPLQRFIKNLSSSLRATLLKPANNNIDAVVKRFVPENAKLLAPKNPQPASRIQYADLDGDLHNEIIASYKLGDRITTFVLKKNNSQWVKAAEIENPGYDTVNFLHNVDMEGNGKKHLLIGLKKNGGTGELKAYSLQDGHMTNIYTHPYRRMEVVNGAQARGNKKPQLAFWNENGKGAYDIDVMNWNGLELEPAENCSQYYTKRVLPYLGQNVKQSPGNAANWYQLADALDKAGMHRDALMAVNFGMMQKSASGLRENFAELKRNIEEKVN